MHHPKLSIILPVFNEAPNLVKMHLELKATLDSLDTLYEIIFVDDGSSDGSFEIVKQLHSENDRVGGISFSRNFGHQIAIMAGLEKSRGEIVITMDADLQHPPEIIPQLIAKYKEGYDIVNTRRIDDESISFFKKLTAKYFYKLINLLSDIQIEAAAADFRLMSRKAVNAFLNIPERDRFTRGLVSWMGFHQAIIPYQARKRYAGTTKYSFSKMLRFAMDGIISFSVRPLKISFFVGTIAIIFSFLYAVYAIFKYFDGETEPGWASLLISVLFLGGMILMSLGVIGEYIARIFNEVKARPLYFIKEEILNSEKVKR